MSQPILGTAIVLSATTEAGQPNAATYSLAPHSVLGVKDVQNLRNPLDVPMLVDEILFNVISTAAAGNINGSDIRLQLRFDSVELVKAYTPLWLLGAGRNFSALSNSSGPTILGGQLNSNIFGMRLASELILYPGEFLQPIFYNAADISSVSVAVRVIVRGRAMPASAKRQSLPWISYWSGGTHAPNANITEETTETNLNNPYGVPLQLDRMVGGIVCDGSGGLGFYGPYGDPTTIDAALNYCQIRIVDYAGRPILRDYTPIGHLCQLQDYSWRLRGTMPPNSFWKAYINGNYASIGVSTPKLQAMLSLIGHHSISGTPQGEARV